MSRIDGNFLSLFALSMYDDLEKRECIHTMESWSGA